MNRATPLVLAALLLLSGLALAPNVRAAPAIGTVTPTTGSTNGGTQLNITGTGFAPGAIVQVGGATLTNIRVTPTLIRAVTPTHAPGTLQVRVINPDGSSALAGTSFTYVSAAVPTVTDFAPANGPSSGGTTLVIHGTGFSTALKPQVAIKTPLTSYLATVQSVTPTTIVAVTSAGSNSGNVIVTNPDGSPSAPLGDPFVYDAVTAPTIDEVTPTSGPANGGVAVKVTGSGFVPGTRVLFDGKEAASVGFITPTELTAVTPAQPEATSTARGVQVVNPDGQSATLNTAYTATKSVPGAAFRVTAAFPRQGPSSGGTLVTIDGHGFAPGLKVKFGSVEAEHAKFVSTTQATAVTPAPCGIGSCTGDITVVNPDGVATAPIDAANRFVFIQQVVIFSAGNLTNQNSNLVDTTGRSAFIVRGTGFSPAQSLSDCPQVYVGGQKANVTSCTTTAIVAVAPTGTPGTKDVQVINRDGRTATLQGALGYTLPLPPVFPPGNDSPATPKRADSNGVPQVENSLEPDGLSPVANVTIRGTGFIGVRGTGAAKDICLWPVVKFNDVPAVVLYCPNDGPEGGKRLDVLPPPMHVIAHNPDSECLDDDPQHPDCTLATISVTNLDGQSVTRPKTVSVFDQFIYVLADPPNAQGYNYTSSRYTQDPAGCGTTTNTDFQGGALPNPTRQCWDSSTDGGARVTVGGVGFAPGTFTAAHGRVGATVFRIGNRIAAIDESYRGSPTDPNGVPINTTLAHLIVPPATVGGKVSLTATNPDGQVDNTTLANFVNYIKPDPPSFSPGSISNSAGSSNGGGNVVINAVITGSKVFGPGATVFFGQTPVQLTFPDPCWGTVVVENCVAGAAKNGTVGNTIRVRAPGHAPGVVPLKVVNLDGQSFTLNNAYTYLPDNPPSLTGVWPTTASGVGGTRVHLIGEDFATGSVGSPSYTRNVSYLKPVVKVETRNAAGAVESSVTLDPANVTVNPAGTNITVILPPHAAGHIGFTVINPNGQATSLSNVFRYLGTQTDVVLSPNSGSQNGGTFIGLAGKGFDPFSPAPSIVFHNRAAGGRNATATGSAVASTTLGVATTPVSPGTVTNTAGAVGPVDVYLVDQDGQTLTLNRGFTYTRAIPPSFTSLTPTVGSTNGGTLVTVKGSGFAPGVRVCVGIPASLPCTPSARGLVSAQVIDAQTLRFATPSGVPGPANITIANPAITSAAADTTLFLSRDRSLFSYSTAASPIVTGVTPTSGNATGGTLVTIRGGNFAAGAQVLFDTTPAANVTVVSPTSITARSPPHDPGAVGVTVSQPGGLSYTLLPAFTYTGNATAPPTEPPVEPPTDTETSTQTSTATGTTTQTGTGQPGTVTEAQIIAANKEVAASVVVTRDGDDNVVTFTLPLSLPATPQGVQVFRSTSPFALVATLERTSAGFQDRSHRDAGAPLASKYLVTVYYANGQGKAATSPDQVPGFAELGEGVSSKDADNARLTLIGYILVGVLALVLVVLLVVLLVRRGRRPPEQPTALDEQALGVDAAGEPLLAPEDAGGPPGGELRHSVNCPNCGAIFEAVGAKPLRMECPTCGKAGILR